MVRLVPARRLYLVVFVALVALLTAAGIYLRQRAINAAEAAAACETPAPPPKPAAPPPRLPDFELASGCAGAPATPASPAPR